MKDISYAQLEEFFAEHDGYTIITHRSPDGDALGTAFALAQYLISIGKSARVVNNDPLPKRYAFMYCDEATDPENFDEQTIVAVDTATEKLFGENLSHYCGKVQLCIDHHISNSGYAANRVLDGGASAAALVLYEFFKERGIAITDGIAKCLYTGIATDTGCFKFENTIPRAHIAAADLMTYDIGAAKINRDMFDLKSRGRLKVEQLAVEQMEFFLGDRCAVICVSLEMVEKSGIEAAEFDGIASIPLAVEGVEVGITMKQREDKLYKLSVRTSDKYNASEICANFGGGGHIRAAGCEIEGSAEEVKAKVLDVVKIAFGEN